MCPYVRHQVHDEGGGEEEAEALPVLGRDVEVEAQQEERGVGRGDDERVEHAEEDVGRHTVGRARDRQPGRAHRRPAFVSAQLSNPSRSSMLRHARTSEESARHDAARSFCTPTTESTATSGRQ
jgi:hypothetical protein